MIDSFHVLTAAHMLYSASDGGFATSIRVIPEMNGSRNPYGIAYGTYERVDPSWVPFSKGHPGQSSSSVEDIGLVTLNTAIGNRTGWFGFGYNNNDSAFVNHYFETAGYPATYGYAGQQMYYSYGRVTGVQGDDLLSTEGNITDIPGQSGSPVWNTSSNIIYGVISAYSGSMASSSQDYIARITQLAFNELQSWRNSDHMPSTAAKVSSVAVSSPASNIAIPNIAIAAATPVSNSISLTLAPPVSPPLESALIPGATWIPAKTPAPILPTHGNTFAFAQTSVPHGEATEDLAALENSLFARL